MPNSRGNSGPVDLVIRGAEVVRSGGLPKADVVTIRNGRIVTVGDGVPRGLVGHRTEFLDVPDGAISAGFQDAHVHPLPAGMQLVSCDLFELHDADAYLRQIASYAASKPDLEWVTGGGWFGDAFDGGLPHRRDLDRVLPDRPAILYSHDMHGAWVNTAALERAGIDEQTPDLGSGRIFRDETGRPSGILVEHAIDLVSRLLPPTGDDEIAEALLAAQARLHAVGVTAWQDAGVGDVFGFPDPYDTYIRLAAEGRLTARVRGAQWWAADRGEEQLDHLVERAKRGTVGHFAASHIKIMQDGIIENCTAALLHPYHGRKDQAGVGPSFIDPEELKRIAILVDAQGLHMHFHAVGDRAVRECLDALEAAIANNPGWDRRHQIAHLDLVHPDDMPRFAQLGVIANVQALWARRDREIVERKLPLIGTEREPYHFPFGFLLRSGAPLAMGSDWPVTDPTPLWAIHTAYRRTAPSVDVHAIGAGVWTDPLEPQESIDVHAAIAAYTQGSAYANALDSDSGVLEEGMAADLAIFDRPLSPDSLEEATVVYTLVEGDVVHG